MATGNGYYNATLGFYQAKTDFSWNTYLGDSAGTDWDAWQFWDSNGISLGVPVVPELPLTFTTDIIDNGSKQLINPLINVEASHSATITIAHGDTIDSSGGAIDSATSVVISPNTSTVDAINARFFQVTISVDNDGDSAGETDNEETFVIPHIRNINVELSTNKITRTIKDLDSSTLSGSVGIRQLDTGSIAGIGTIEAIITQPHTVVTKYVADDYVVEGDSGDGNYFLLDTGVTPFIFIDKATSPPTLNIFDANTFGARKNIDCTFDAVVTGMVQIATDSTGSIKEQ